jgi:peptide chain release factor 2
LSLDSGADNLWDDPDKAQKLLKTLSSKQGKFDLIHKIDEELGFYLEILTDDVSDSGADLAESATSVEELWESIQTLQRETFFGGQYDVRNAIISIQAGAGGVDAQDFAEMLMRMYSKYAESRGFEVEMLEYVKGQEAGIKKATLAVKGEYSYGNLKFERGVHRLVRISPFNSQGQRHTAFAMVQVLPEFEEVDEDVIDLKGDDLRVDVFRSGGPGGQSVNTTDSAVRITHLPTGIVASAQTERSQLQNKEIAMRLLRAKLWEREQADIKEEREELRENVSISWGNHIRSYVLNPYQMVKDLRSGYETSQVEEVFEGHLDPIINSVISLKPKP